MKASISTVWNQLWNSHHQAKRLLMFALPINTNKKIDTLEKEKKQQEGQKPPSYRTPQKVGLILGPLLFLSVLLFFFPEGLSYEGRMVLATTLWVATWWITEAIPIPAASLLPIILLPITGALDGSAVTSSYGDPIIFLFLGGFFIALAMEKWDLHKTNCVNDHFCDWYKPKEYCSWFYGSNRVPINVGFKHSCRYDDASDRYSHHVSSCPGFKE